MYEKSARNCDLARVPIFSIWFLAVLIGCFVLPDFVGGAVASTNSKQLMSAKMPSTWTGDVSRSVLTRAELFVKKMPSKPIDDMAGFGVPDAAAEPGESFEGTLTLNNVASDGNFSQLADVFGLIPAIDSPWKHLAPFRFQFVQSGSDLIPAQQGLVFVESSPTWNYILGPGRVWNEKSDEGYTRAAFPFALVQRNQNCVHNGEMTFLFSNSRSPNISNVYYQITQETCYPMKFNLWGMVSATYSPGAVADGASIRKNHQAELARRIPVKPFSDLAKDFPNSHIDLTAFTAAYKRPENVTTYGLMIHGTNYISGCPTRSGEYAYCAEMRVPSYSIAKSAFAGVALMRLGQLYGSEVYGLKIKDFVPHSVIRGNWAVTTFGNTSDMATGNFNLGEYEADEDSPVNDTFLIAEAYAPKLADAFAFKNHFVLPGTKWVYQSAATFILTQAMNEYFHQHGGRGDMFSMVRDDVYAPLHVNAGGLTTIRTDDSAAGAPAGYYGLFFNQDDIAKIGNFLNTSGGAIDGKQVLEPARLSEALFRSANVKVAGVPIEGRKDASLVGTPSAGHAKSGAENGRRYSHGFWGRRIGSAEHPEYSCDYWTSFMAGYGGNIVMLLPNGATYYIFSDGMEFPWESPMHEINKLAPMCNAN
jgi:hypothetical protein